MTEDLATSLLSTRLCNSQSGQVIEVSEFAQVPYSMALKAMQERVSRPLNDLDGDLKSAGQIWVLEHDPVYTQGTACQMQPLLPSAIPVIKTDRGGQITYHGPGQLVLYPLLHLRPLGLGVKTLVASLEQAVIDTLATFSVNGERRHDAPGVYVNGAKIAALGLRIRRGMSYHGLSLNIDMDLSPFNNIDPCGYQGLSVTQLRDIVPNVDAKLVRATLVDNFLSRI